MRKPDGSVMKALKGKTISEVMDEENKITLVLDDGSSASFYTDFRQGADGGYYNEMILAVDNVEIAWR